MKTATVIDCILTNSFIDTNFKSAVIKSGFSDHFPICLFLPSSRAKSESGTTFIYKRLFNTLAIEMFNQQLYELTGKKSKWIKTLMKLTMLLYEKFFYHTTITLQKNREVTKKDLQTPWVTTGMKKSSKCKQLLYEKFLKNETS